MSSSFSRSWMQVVTLAARNLRRNVTRTAIALSAIGFGVCALLQAGGFPEWIFMAMRQARIETGLGHLHVSRPGFRDAGAADLRAFLLPQRLVGLGGVRG